MKFRKMLALLTVFVLMMSMLPSSVFAGDRETCTIDTSAVSVREVNRGGRDEVDLDSIFTDSKGHAITYSYDVDEYTYDSLKPVLNDNVLDVYPLKLGDYDVEVTATCSNGNTVQATIPFSVIVSPDEGNPAQYGYNETPAESVLVYVTFSSDGVPLVGQDDNNTKIAHLPVRVPYFDLGLYGLQEYYRFHTEAGMGDYTDNIVVERPTAMHLFIYMTEKYYMGLPESKCGKGLSSGVMDYDEMVTMYNMFGDEAYQSTGNAYTVTQGAMSSFMTSLWGHDMNLMYYRNHLYPLHSPGWGATADYVLLSDYNVIEMAFFTNYGFWTNGNFCCFDKEVYEVGTFENLEFETLAAPTSSVDGGYSDELTPIDGLTVKICDEDWDVIDTLESADELFEYTFTEPGTYHLVGLDPDYGTDVACKAPATADVEVYAKDPGEIKTAQALLQNDITMKMYGKFNLQPDEGSVSMIVDMNGEATEIEGELQGDGRYLFSYEDISPENINDDFTAIMEYTVNGEPYDDILENYSVRKYCLDTLRMSDEDLGKLIPSTATLSEMRSLLVDTLFYGAEAQKYVGHNTDDLATAGLTADEAAMATDYVSPTVSDGFIASADRLTGTKDPDHNWVSAQAVLDKAARLRLYFEAPNGIEGLTVTASNASFTREFTNDQIQTRSGLYYIELSDIAADTFGDQIDASFKVNGQATGQTVHYNINTYVSQTQNHATFGELAKRLFNYGKSSKAYTTNAA